MRSEMNNLAYSPLPQKSLSSNSNSEDEDDHHLARNDSIISRETADHSRISDITAICQTERFCPPLENPFLSREDQPNGTFSKNNSFPTMMFEGQSPKRVFQTNKVTPLRKLGIVISIMLCLFTIYIFLYLIPCNGLTACSSESKPFISWDKTLNGIELQGRISVVLNNLIFLFRAQQFGELKNLNNQVSKSGGGVLCLQSSNGDLKWLLPLKQNPVDISCNILSSDRSGTTDCLITGKNAQLVCLEPTAGKIHWYSNVYTYEKLPLPIADVNNDLIDDLISVEIASNNQNIILLSGRTGKLIIREPIPDCVNINLLSISSDFMLSYSCSNNKNSEEQQLNMTRIIDSRINMNQPQLQEQSISVKIPPLVKAFPVYNFTNVWILAKKYQLFASNEGGRESICPLNNKCQSHVQLIVKHDNESRQIWNSQANNSFITEPVIMNTAGLQHTAGFVVKFWNWNKDYKKNITKESVGLYQNTLSECVTIVYVNNTQVHSMNASQVDVYQICKGTDCQPSLSQQYYSTAIEDLDSDGIMELINYRSSYNSFREFKDINFTSTIQVIKLESIF